jgi:protein-export membrane protein SecD
VKSFLKNPRILIWLFFIVVSILLIAPNPNPRGLLVVSVDRTVNTNIELGEIIYSIDGLPVNHDLLAKDYYGVVKVDTNKGTKYISVNGTLGVGADPLPTTNIKFGLDLKGGVRAILQPNLSTNATLEQIISTLEERINFYGLRESVFRPVYYEGKGFVEISIAGGTKEELKSLIESQGNFEAKIPFVLPVANNQAALKLDKNYDIFVKNSSIIINSETVNYGESFSLSGIDITFNGIYQSKVNLTASVFNGNDIITIFIDPQRTRIEKAGSGYKWTFGVQLSSNGAQKFAWVTSNTNARGDGYLDAPIVFYLDNRFIDSLNIAVGLKGKAETEIAISGGATTSKEASKAMIQLQSILRSGALPTTVEIVQLDTISPTLGAGFLKNAISAAGAALIGVIIIVSLRYRKPKLVVPMIFISITEILIVIGMSVVIGWTIDLAAIAGLIASVGTGISDQIIILDRTLRKEAEYEETLHEKIKKAFFVVFGTAGTVIAAMLPLLFTGFGMLRGFALITIVGVLVGILITRPAYGVIIEHIKKD